VIDETSVFVATGIPSAENLDEIAAVMLKFFELSEKI